MKTNPYLTDFYKHYDVDSRLISKHGSVEFLTTMHYIEKYIKPCHRVLEIGAGTGRYSHALARQGYTVDAVELVAHNIEVFRKNTREEERISITHGNAMDLSAFPTIPMTLRCFSALCTTCTAGRINCRHCAKPSV